MSTNNNKTIAQNTLFLYFRMMFTMLVSLYTSRVILQILGVDDFGIYQTVGGVVTLLSFVNGALATGSSRFLTYELGTRDEKKLKQTFSSVLTVHILLALIIVLVAETAGLWFVYNKLVIEPERMEAAIIAYHLSILTAIITITQVPYNASIISHEKMSIYAYLSIIEVSLKLGIVYLLQIGNWDKLKLYAVLLCIIQIGIALFYRFYCTIHFKETRYKFEWNRKIIKNVLGYSGWNLLANTAIALNNQGATILINMFFSPAIVTSRAIANQVNMAASQFINNFRTAANPQIVKRYAAGDFEGSKNLLLSSTKYSFYLMLLLGIPIIVSSESLLKLWLGVVPDYAVVFLQLSIITSFFQVFDTSFYTGLYAKGQIKENALTGPTIGFLIFPFIYLLFKIGCSPISLAWCLLVYAALLGLIQKPILLVKIAQYQWADIYSVFIPCAKVALSATIVPICLIYFLKSSPENSILINLSISFISFISTAISIWFLGLNSEIKSFLIAKIRNKLLHI